MKKTKQDSQAGAPQRPCLAFLLPTYKSPAMCAELLCTAHTSGLYGGCSFILLLDRYDNALASYKACVENLHKEGMDVGYIVSDGVSYPGMVNRVAHIIDADCICVIDSKHIPMPKNGTMEEAIKSWLSCSVEPMRLGVFGEQTAYPVLTQKLVERLGYVFHPLFNGRKGAELWTVTLAANVGVATSIPECIVIESGADGVEILGHSDSKADKWAMGVLEGSLVTECARLSDHVVQ